VIEKIKKGDLGNDLFVKVLRDIFDENDEVNITISEEDLSSDSDGYFEFDQSSNQSYGVLDFQGTLKINSDYTKTGSQDWILATLIHEMIHGYINYQRTLRVGGYITQAEFDEKFPLYTKSDSGHNEMGFNYTTTIASILRLNNPSLSLYEALSLARAGLDTTEYWKTLTTTEKNDVLISLYLEGERGLIADQNR